MLADLFTDPGNEGSSSQRITSKYLDKPPAKRKEINLCGIINQGATCYLNTLIQTLFLTREFRDNLFSLTEEELGLVPSTNAQQSKVRVILIELQRLFAQLLMLDQDSCSTNRLTDSFGWTNNEEMQQHDVQELNRILFAAIEKTLVNTKKAKLIHELYRGTYVNKTKCLSCLTVFEREEEFLDLQITVQGSSGLDQSLINSFLLHENLNGNNQYRCEKCNNEYRDAERYCQLKTLPPILTFSLLRFTYDLKTFQRIKETSKFDFPTELDLANYMEDLTKTNLNTEYTKYELFSIIIHSGSAYGGHYHCFIKDFDNLGNWSIKKKSENHKEPTLTHNTNNKNDKEIILICCDEEEFKESNSKNEELVNLDFLKYNAPVDLLKAFIYNKYKYKKIKLDALCADLSKSSGMTWNKNFKSKYGSIEKFLKKNDDIFDFNLDSKLVNLKQHDRINIISSINYDSKKNADLIESCLKECDLNSENKELINEKANQKSEDKKDDWYDFDDSRINPIKIENISKQFEGKESAYMLFYRRKSSIKNDNYSPYDKIPLWLQSEIQSENSSLITKRSDYENRENLFKIDCYLDTDFYLEQNVLNLKQEFEGKSIEITLSKEKSLVGDLKTDLLQICTDNKVKIDDKRKETILNVLLDDSYEFDLLLAIRVDTSTSSNSFTSNMGRYSYYVQSLLNDPNQNIFNLIKTNDSHKSFLIINKQKNKFPIGDQYEPIRIIVKYFDVNYQINEISFTFTKSTLIRRVKEEISAFYLSQFSNNDYNYDSLQFSYLPNQKIKLDDKILLEANVYDFKSLNELKLKNGDFVFIESNFVDEELFNQKNTNSSNKEQKDLCETIELRKINVINLLNTGSSNISQEFEFELSETISNIKVISMSSFDIKIDSNNIQLRYMDEEELNSNTDLLNYICACNTYDLNENERQKMIKKINGISLYDDITLNELIQSNKILNDKLVFLLCEGKAPLKAKNEIVLKCKFDKKIINQNFDVNENFLTEITIDSKNTLIANLIDKLVEKSQLRPIEKGDNEIYYLKTLDWLGDGDLVLNKLDQSCFDAQLKHNQCLLLIKGKLIPPNHFKIRVFISKADYENYQYSDELVVLNEFIDDHYEKFGLLEELIVSNEMRLEDFTILVQSLLIEQPEVKSCENIRLRLLKRLSDENEVKSKFQMKKRLFEMSRQLKQLGFQQETDLCVQILKEEDEHLNQGIVLLDCIKFDSETKKCQKNTFKQIFWNINNGASVSSLKESILKSYSDLLNPNDIFRMHVAKRIYDRSSWIVLKDLNQSSDKSSEQSLNCNNNISAGNKNKKKQNKQNPSQPKTNLRQSPFNLDDGDLIAFILTESSGSKIIASNDFMSQVDLDLVNKENITKAELARLKKEKNNKQSDNKKEKRTNYRRPEVGITIKVDDDFNN